MVFVGGFPDAPPKLVLDIVNPHHEQDGRDKINLSPNTFLCIEPGTIWHFVFYVRPGATDADEILEAATNWLTDALTQLGIGAKTASGYGRFRKPSQADLTALAKEAKDLEAAAKQQDKAQEMLKKDYANEKTFRSCVTNNLNPGQLKQLQQQIALLQKPANAEWCNKLKQLLASKEYKDIRNRLRDESWFPKEWLPQL